MDLIYDAIDTLNRVGKMAFTGGDTELEAISEGFIGKIYYKGLKNLTKARPHLYDCVRLANCFHEKNVSEEAWFKLATLHLKEVREVLDKQASETEKAANK
jgi:hypothetical protein